MLSNGIKNKRKNRFINIWDEEENLTPYKRHDYNAKNNVKNKKNLILKQMAYSSFNRKVIVPMIILLIIIFFSSLIRKNRKSYINDNKLNLIYNENKKYKSRKQYSREEALTRGRNYLDKCLDGLLFNNDKSFTISNEPKISVIIPVFNNDKMIKSVIRSIQNQKMLDVEIIIVNDFSKDNSMRIIEDMQKEDPRIKIINNEKNMGILYSRSIGVLESKGKYIFNLDHDDFILDEDLFDVIYEEAEEGNFDIISFMEIDIKKYNDKIDEMIDVQLASHPDNFIIRQKELILFSLFKNDTFHFIDNRIWCKLFKAEIYKKALNLLGRERYSTYNIYNENLVSLFAICNVAESYKYIRKYGIFHYVDRFSTTHMISHDHYIQMEIFFCDVVFDLSKNENKRFAVNMALKIDTINEETKINLGKVLKKIMECEYIKENDKEKIRKKNEELGLRMFK